MSSTYTFRVLRSSWGIRVTLRAEARSGPARPGATPVTDGLLVLDATNGAGLSPEQMGMLVKGLEVVAPELISAVPDLPLTVEIQDVEYNELDYQHEGLAAAVLGWAVTEFRLTPREIPVTYNRSDRRYVFDFDAVPPAG